MATYQPRQRYVWHRGREFHFVSYEGTRADPRRNLVATPPTWFLLSAGKRWAALPQLPDQGDQELDAELIAWLEANVFAT